MRRIAVINQCGGVGKTTIATSLGHALTMSGHRVTLVDLDPKGCLTAGYGIFRAPSKGIDRVMLNGTDLRSVQVGARDLLTLIPAGITLSEMEQVQGGRSEHVRRLSRAIEGQFEDQAFIFFDCPSGNDMLSVNAIFAADELLIPVTDKAESLNGALKTLVTLKRLQPYLPRTVIARIVLNRIATRDKASKAVRQRLQQHFPKALLETAIQEGRAISESTDIGRTIFEYKAASHSAREFRDLAGELIALSRANLSSAE
jgi:chromosome partitioning protein